MLKKIIAALLIFSFTHTVAQNPAKKKTILFVGAHPDDETAISEVLTKYARLGNKVYVIVATNGKGGTRVTKIPEGDSLGNIRKTESECGCKALGIEPPIFFGIERLFCDSYLFFFGIYFKSIAFVPSLSASVTSPVSSFTGIPSFICLVGFTLPCFCCTTCQAS